MHHLLAPHIQEFMELQSYIHLDQIVDPEQTTIWRQGWCSGNSLGLPEIDIPEWNRYRKALGESHIHLQDRPNELIWGGDPTGYYSSKVGYVCLCTNYLNREEKWWWRKVWKMGFPMKARLLMWTNLENKTPTCDNLQKRNCIGPGWCSLCKVESETVSHLFITCIFS